MKHILQSLEQWYRSMPGSMLVEMERTMVSRLLTHSLGTRLLQMGGKSDMSFTSASDIHRRIYLAPFRMGHTEHPAIQAELDELPIEPSTIDVVVCAHMLEFVDNPEVVLKEIYDSLKPNGQLILFGFNPLSLWGIARYRYGKRGFPWEGRFYLISQMKRWIRHTGFRLVSSKTVCFRPAMTDPQRAQRWYFLEAIGQTICPGLGAAYMITARKRVEGMTPLAEKWQKEKYVVNNGYAEPTTRVSFDE